MQKQTNLRLVMICAAAVGFLAGFLPWLQPPNGFGHAMNAYDRRIFPLATWAPLACLAAGLVMWFETFRKVDMRKATFGFSAVQISVACGLITTCLGLGFSRLDLAYQIGLGTYLGMFCGLTLVCVGMLDLYRGSQPQAAIADQADAEQDAQQDAVSGTATAAADETPSAGGPPPADEPPTSDEVAADQPAQPPAPEERATAAPEERATASTNTNDVADTEWPAPRQG